MSCILEKVNGSLYVTMSFKRDELLKDIDTVAYAEGAVMGPDTGEARHEVQDVVQRGNIERVQRIMDLTVARVREALYEFTRCDIDRSAVSDDYSESPVYGIVMKVPSTFSQTTLNLLEQLVHELIVARVMEDWMGIVNPGKMQYWQLRAETCMDEIRQRVRTSVMGMRRRQHYF